MTIKRTLSLMMSLMLLIFLAAPLASAETGSGYISTESYALNYNGAYDGCKWQYFSPYISSWYYDGIFDYNNSISFTLYNTTTGEHFPTYCTDIDTGLNNNSDFRRLNLEDSTYAAGSAGVLRSVMLKGFPNTDLATLGTAAGVDNLTVGEAVTATQLAVWQTAHGSLMKVKDFVYSFDTQWNSDGVTEHFGECYAEIESGYASEANEELIESHIKAVFDYLVNLEPTAPTGIAVSGSSFINWSDTPTVTTNEDGTCNVSATATVNVYKTDADTMTLSAVVGGYCTSTNLTSGENTVTLTIENVPADVAKGDVTLAIDGTQTLPQDVYLYDAVGDRGTSQSLIGIDGSQLPVHAELTVEAERVVHFYKTTKVVTGQDENGNATYERLPLEGIVFDIYLIATTQEYESGKKDVPTTPDVPGRNPDFTVITDTNGYASFNLTKQGMPDGVYLVVERSQTAIVAPVSPFYVVMPATNAEGTDWVYEITVEPKNEVQGKVEIEKDVISLGNDESTVDTYAPHTWIIGATVPLDIADGKSYVISDTLDNRLDYLGNLKVQVETLDGSQVAAVLTEAKDYTLTVTDVDSLADGKPSDAFTVSLTAVGMDRVAEAVGSSSSEYMIRVYFDAQINGNANMGEEIPNQATLDYTNSVNFDFNAESDIPKVYTGGIHILKADSEDNTPLSGAVFQVYRNATEAEVTAGTGLVYLKDDPAPKVLVTFFDNPDLTGDKVDTASSDENGNIVIYGLAYGTYYLVETKAPAGYNLLTEPVELTIDAVSHTVEKTVTVLNTSGAVLPETGGMGTTLFTLVGLILTLGAGVLMITRKRMNVE